MDHAALRTRPRTTWRARRDRPGAVGAGRSGGVPGELLRRLRGSAGDRPRVDPGLSGGLRAWLEDGVAPGDEPPAPARPAVVDRWSLLPLQQAATQPDRAAGPTLASVLDAIVGALFRQLVTTGGIGRTGAPLDDALDALGVDDELTHVARFVSELPAHARASLRKEVDRHAQIMSTQWSHIPSAWLPRTRERMSVPLAGGRVVVLGTADLVLGAPSDGRASVCLMDVRAGEPRAAHRSDRHLAALLETLRSGAAPFRVATYYSATGTLDSEDVTDPMLVEMVQQVLGAVHRLAGSAPASPAPQAALGDGR